MRSFRSRSLRLLPWLLAAGLLGTGGLGQAQSVPPSADTSSIYRRNTGIDSSGDYMQEVHACQSGRTQQSKATCLEEARNARADLRRGDLADDGENYTANALARCEPLMGEYRVACEARVMGFGSTSGSVAEGGLIRRVETVVIPPGAESIRIQAQTPDTVLLLPTPIM